MAIERILTIGAHGWRAEALFDALMAAKVDLLVDVRQRRGVRGAEYAFANHKRLVAALEEREIGYVHRLDLAPTTALREAQYAVDKEQHVGKRSREALAPVYAEAYTREILGRLDLSAVADELGEQGSVIVLFCVERLPAACHRSIAAEALASVTGARVEHLTPD